MPPLSHPHKGLPWAPPQSAPQDDRAPHPVRLASEAAPRSQSPYNRGDTVAIWTLTGLVLAACGGGGGGGGGPVISGPPAPFGFDLSDPSAAENPTLQETDDPRDFRISIATQNAQGQVTYQLSGDDADFFAIDDDTVIFKNTTTLDQDVVSPKSTYAFTVTASDESGAAPLTRTFTLNVADVDDNAPTDMALSVATGAVDETDQTTAQKLADITFTDMDTVGTNTASLTTTSNIFEIRNGNELWLKAGQVLDFETATSHAITIRADQNSSLTQVFTLTVTDVATTILLDQPSLSVDETNQTTAQKLSDITLSGDLTPDPVLTNFTLSNDTLFEIRGDAQSGFSLWLKAGQTLDYETDTRIDVDVTYDGQTPQRFTLNVADVDDNAPTDMALSVATGAVDETDQTTARKLADITFTDVDTVGTNTASLTTTSTIFEIRNGNQLWLKAGQVLDYETATSHSITIRAAQNSSLTQSFTLNVANVDEPPEVLRHEVTYVSEGGRSDTSVVSFTGENGAERPVDPEGMTPENNTDYDFYWRVKTLPFGGTFTSTSDGTNYSSVNVRGGFDTNSPSGLEFRFTHDGGNRIAGADDVNVLVLEVADKEFSSDPAVSEQYMVFIVREASYSVSAAGDDTGIRFVVPHVGVGLGNLTLTPINSTNSGLFEIRVIDDATERQGVPEDLVIYGIFALDDADLSTAVDEVSVTDGKQIDFQVTYDADLDPDTTGDTQTINFNPVDIV